MNNLKELLTQLVFIKMVKPIRNHNSRQILKIALLCQLKR